MRYMLASFGRGVWVNSENIDLICSPVRGVYTCTLTEYGHNRTLAIIHARAYFDIVACYMTTCLFSSTLITLITFEDKNMKKKKKNLVLQRSRSIKESSTYY